MGHLIMVRDTVKIHEESDHYLGADEEWIKEKQKTTYVKIKEGWQNCEFKYDGWVVSE